MRFPRNAKIFRGHFDVIPFASVFFLLVIFLLLNTYLVFPPGVEIELPEASGLPGASNPKVIVAIDSGRNLYYQNQVIEKTALRDALVQARETAEEPLTLVILADRRVPHQEVVNLSVMARDVGVGQVVLATRPSPVLKSE